MKYKEHNLRTKQMNRIYLTIALFFASCMVSLGQTVKGDWHGALDVKGTKLNIVFHFKDGNRDWTMDSPDQGAKGIAVILVKNQQDTVALEIPQLRAAYSSILKDGKLIGKFSQSGMTFELNLAPGNLVRNRPQTPQPPFPYTRKELTFTNDKDDAVLAGTLTMPVNVKNPTLVVFTSGSGQQNRDEELFEHKPFAVIADRLARKGIASFRYDDRGVGKSNGMRNDLTTVDFAYDALCAVKKLKKTVKPKKIGIIGHSEGGSIAFMLAGNQPKNIDFIVSLAGPSVIGERVFIKQIMKQSEISGVKTGDEQVRANVEKLKSKPWYAYFLSYDPTEVISKIKCPVFAAYGSKDVQVDAEENIGMLKQTLKIKKNDKLIIYDGLNHLFQHAKTGFPNEYGDIEETFSDEVLTDIIDWINDL